MLGGATLLGRLASRRFGVGFSREGLADLSTGVEIVRIGAPQAAERVLFAAADIPLNALVLRFGTAANAGFQVGRRRRFFARVPAIGIGVAASAFVGMNVGPGQVATSVR